MKAVIVLGMHRSGTSALARVVNLLGVSLGRTDDMMQPNEINPKGFWENQSLRVGVKTFRPRNFPTTPQVGGIGEPESWAAVAEPHPPTLPRSHLVSQAAGRAVRERKTASEHKLCHFSPQSCV